MAIVTYTATVRNGRTIELSEDADWLGLVPGDSVRVTIERPAESADPARDPAGLDILREITESHRGQPRISNTHTARLIDEARDGAMYGNVSDE